VKLGTAKAILVIIPDLDDAEVWIPKSVVHDDSEVYDSGHTGELVLPQWFVDKNRQDFGM
jgi:hypothetical protein